MRGRSLSREQGLHAERLSFVRLDLFETTSLPTADILVVYLFRDAVDRVERILLSLERRERLVVLSVGFRFPSLPLTATYQEEEEEDDDEEEEGEKKRGICCYRYDIEPTL